MPRPTALELDDILSALEAQIPTLATKYGVQQLWVFGSYARGEQTSQSDLDLLVDLGDAPLSFLDFLALEHELEDLLKLEVDLAEASSFSEEVLRHVLTERVSVRVKV